MNDQNKTIAFIESLPETAPSITQPLEEKLPNVEDVQKLFDKLIFEIAKKGDYAATVNVYSMAQMYGRNCSLESFFTALSEMCKKGAKPEQLHVIDLLCKNLKNTSGCIESMSKHKKEMMLALMLGFVSSLLEQNS